MSEISKKLIKALLKAKDVPVVNFRDQMKKWGNEEREVMDVPTAVINEFLKDMRSDPKKVGVYSKPDGSLGLFRKTKDGKFINYDYKWKDAKPR